MSRHALLTPDVPAAAPTPSAPEAGKPYMSQAIQTLADVAAHGGVTLDDLRAYSEDDMGELLKDELRLKVHTRNKILKEWRAARKQAWRLE